MVSIRAAAYDDPDAAKLIAEVQQEYVRRYGGEDSTPVQPAEFTPPLGIFLVGYLGDLPVCSGGWRAHGAAEPGFASGDAEIKRMYVVPGYRGRGLARDILVELERTAAESGRRRMILETGLAQPEAIGLYLSSGYAEIDKYGVYAAEELSRCFAKEL